MQVTITRDEFKLKQTFTISRGSRDVAQVLTLQLEKDGHVGRGECYPYARYGESLDSVSEQIRAIETEIVNGLTRDELRQRMPAGAARNAIDCAMWDLEAKQQGVPVWQLAGCKHPTPSPRPTPCLWIRQRPCGQPHLSTQVDHC